MIETKLNFKFDQDKHKPNLFVLNLKKNSC